MTGVRWVAVACRRPHSLWRRWPPGRHGRIWNDFYRSEPATTRNAVGLRSTAPADRTAARRHPRGDRQAARRGWANRPVTLRREVCTAAAGAGTEQEFFARLRAAGVLVRERHSTVNPSEVTGYAVGLPQHTARDGGVVWYSDGKLAADLTLPKLHARWDGPAAEDAPLAGEGVPAAAVRGVLRTLVTRAAEQATGETGFFAGLREAGVLVRLRFSEIDPGQVTGYAVTLPGHSRVGRNTAVVRRRAAGRRAHPAPPAGAMAPGTSGTFRGIAVHCSGTGRALQARGPPGCRRHRTHPPLRRQ